jgi:hypothetical protein
MTTPWMTTFSDALDDHISDALDDHISDGFGGSGLGTLLQWRAGKLMREYS